MSEDLLARVARIAARTADVIEDDESVQEVVQPLAQPSGGYVDLVFDEGKLLNVVDARGNRTEIGNWLEVNGRKVLRIPWPILGDVTRNTVGRTRNVQNTENTAAQMQLPKSGTARAKVLSTFILDWRNNGDGLIDEDVAARLQMNLYTAAPRRTELVNMGWLRASGKYGRTKMNSESIMWELSTEAIVKLNLPERKK